MGYLPDALVNYRKARWSYGGQEIFTPGTYQYFSFDNVVPLRRYSSRKAFMAQQPILMNTPAESPCGDGPAFCREAGFIREDSNPNMQWLSKAVLTLRKDRGRSWSLPNR